MRRLLRALLVAFLVLVAGAGALAVRALLLRSPRIEAAPAGDLGVDGAAAAPRLAEALRHRTVSSQDGEVATAEFAALHAWLASAFPAVHARLAREPVGAASLLYTWPGSDAGLRPVLLLAHQDVVPVADAEAATWTQPPFGGVVADGHVWGRGALDDKASLVAMLEAVERLAAAGRAPRRTLLLAFGHDEEVGGGGGAAAIAALLGERGVAPEFVLDEGEVVLTDGVPGVERPVALLGIAEKGYLTLELVVEAEGGHSSMPPPETAIGILAAAVRRVEQSPLPARLAGPSLLMLERLAPEMGFGARLAVANRYLFGAALERRLAATASGNAVLRTTTAPTLFHAGVKDNVLPRRAQAAVNFRILPGDSVGGVVEHVRRAVADPRVQVVVRGPAVEPSPVSPAAGHGYETIARSIAEVFPDALVVPALVLGGTDARHYTRLCAGVYRFAPLRVSSGDLVRFHGQDERLAVGAYGDAIRFYLRLLETAVF
jgi:carboxypeptidase PM20D1